MEPDQISRTLLAVLARLTPAERLAFVLHEVFALAIEEIAPIVGRTPPATRRLTDQARQQARTAFAMTLRDGRITGRDH